MDCSGDSKGIAPQDIFKETKTAQLNLLPTNQWRMAERNAKKDYRK
jgi:hypothetical protein